MLSAVIDAQPLAIGFVLPRSFILEKQFSEQRRRIEDLYGFVEIVELPDRIFGASSVESAALIARDLRAEGSTRVTIRSTEVADQDRAAFLKTGRTTVQRETTREVVRPEGSFGFPCTICGSILQKLRSSERFSNQDGGCAGIMNRIWLQAMLRRKAFAEGI